MYSTLSAKLLNTLQRGKEQLGTEALRRVIDFVGSQQTEGGAFQDKSGKADLYYTSFGWMLSYLLGVKTDPRQMKVYLSQQDPEGLDLLHYAAYMRCRMLYRLVKGGKIGLFIHTLFPSRIRVLDLFEHLPHNDPRSPYSQFIRISLLEDAGQRIRDKKGVMDSLTAYRLSGGGYGNRRDGLTATTNATAAALAVKGQLDGYRQNEEALHLRNRQDPSGGFRATAVSPVPDLLSTATAIFVLHSYHTQLNYPARDFIEAHWLNSGGFSATLLEDTSDVEYTFYGLLALGAVSCFSGIFL